MAADETNVIGIQTIGSQCLSKYASTSRTRCWCSKFGFSPLNDLCQKCAVSFESHMIQAFAEFGMCFCEMVVDKLDGPRTQWSSEGQCLLLEPSTCSIYYTYLLQFFRPGISHFAATLQRKYLVPVQLTALLFSDMRK